MPLIILALFILVPLAEISVFIAAGNAIGLLPTIATVVVTAIIGTFLLQRQGLSAMARTQEAMAAGRIPVESMMDGVYLLMAGAFLLTPGFITDAVGFLLFVPPFRRWLGHIAFKRFMRGANINVSTSGSSRHTDTFRTGKPDADIYNDGAGPVIDGEFEHMDPGEPNPSTQGKKGDSSSPWRDPGKRQ